MEPASPKTSDGDRQEHGLAIEPEHLEGARNNHNPAVEHIVEACSHYVRNYHGSDLSDEEVGEVVQAAVADTWHFIKEGHGTKEVLSRLKAALNRHKQRVKRHRQRFRTGIDLRSVPQGGADPIEMFIEVDHILGVVQALQHLLPRALHELSDRDHDVVVEYYGLMDYGILPRLPDPPEFLSEEAHRKAFQRARSRFGDHLERLILIEIEVGRGDPLVLHDALKFIRGGILRSAFIHTRDTESEQFGD